MEERRRVEERSEGERGREGEREREEKRRKDKGEEKDRQKGKSKRDRQGVTQGEESEGNKVIQGADIVKINITTSIFLHIVSYRDGG